MNEFLAGIVKHMKRDATMDYLSLIPIPSEHTFTKRFLNIPHTMGLEEIVGLLELIMRTNRIHYPWRDRGTVFRELYIIKPLEKLAKPRDNRGELVGQSCSKGLAKCSEHKYLINYRPAQIL